MESRYKTLIFDFDGVISDSLDLAIEGINLLGDLYGLPQISTRYDLASLYHRELGKSLDKYGLTPEQTNQFFKEHASFMRQNAHKIKTFEGVPEVIQQIPQKKVLITSSYLTAVDTILSNNGFTREGLFEYCIGKEMHATKTQKISLALEEIGENRGEAVYIGDMASDILYSKKVPIDIIAVGYGYHPPEFLQKFRPNHLALSITDVRGYVENGQESNLSHGLYQRDYSSRWKV
jgi:phosphoglycolate phosphatase